MKGALNVSLYPKANMTSQRISDFMRSIGGSKNVLKFFENHMKWIKENISSDKAINRNL